MTRSLSMIPPPRSITIRDGTGHVQCRIEWPCGCVAWVWRPLGPDPATPWRLDRTHCCAEHDREAPPCLRYGHCWVIERVHGSLPRPEALDLRCLTCGFATTRLGPL